MKVSVVGIAGVALISVGLMAAKCSPGAAPQADANAWCKTTYSVKTLCEADSKCRWVREGVCKANEVPPLPTPKPVTP